MNGRGRKSLGVGAVRTFATGATRDTDAGKLDYEGFLSPLALVRYAEYMNEHRIQPDGKLRESDNWQRGIPPAAYMKSMWRHFIDLWKLHRGLEAKDRVTGKPVSMEEALCAVIFNAMGYLHERLARDHAAGAARNTARTAEGKEAA
jgi:hypothetical protein